ncbi:MAG TPA: Pvc16 family protein [Acidimicrobiia bacterium]|jgi:hypothetical protein
MLHLLDDGLEAFLRAELGPAASGLDVSFALPDKDWAAGVNRPTLNLFLYSVSPVSSETAVGFEQLEHNGERRRQRVLPRMAFSYLVSAWVADGRDEHRLLGAALAALARTRPLEPPYLPEALAAVLPHPMLQLDMNPPDGTDLWPALGGRYHPCLCLVVNASVDPAFAVVTAAPVEEISLSVVRR